MKTRINKVGFEIEGEMSNDLHTALSRITGGDVVGDASIRNCLSDKHQELNLREFRSPVMDVQEATQDKRGIFEVLDKAYKKKEFHFNQSTGFHVHLSFRPKLCPDLFSKEFVDYFHSRLLVKYGAMAERRERESIYCKMNITEEQIAQYNGERYYSINLQGAMRKHGTIEFRIFPATMPKKMLQFIKFTVQTTNAFIRQEDKLCKRVVNIDLEPLERKAKRTKTLIIEGDKIPKRLKEYKELPWEADYWTDAERLIHERRLD